MQVRQGFGSLPLHSGVAQPLNSSDMANINLNKMYRREGST